MNKYLKNFYFLINFVSKTYLDLIFVYGIRWSVCVLVTKSCLFATPLTIAHQAPLFMEFSKQEYWSGLPFPSSGDLPNPEMEPGSPTLQTDYLLSESLGKPFLRLIVIEPTDSFIKKTYPCTNCISVATLSWIRKTA